jgi:hypothetical protein
MTPSVPSPPRLPEYRPKGMSKVDKFAAWLLAFVLVIFSLSFAGIYLNRKLPAPRPTASPTASPHHSHAASDIPWYVVVNTHTGYTWWLNTTGGHFTEHSAQQFAKGHSGYHVYSLKLTR